MRWAYNDNGLIRIPVRCAPDGYYLRWYYNGWHYWFFLPGTHVIETEGERYRTLSRRKITVSSGQITRGQATAIRTIMNTREVYMWTDGGWAAIRIEPGSLKIYQSEVAGTEMEMTMIVGSREVTQTTGFSPVPPVPVVVPTYPWCETPIVVATQIWQCKNYDIAYPGSRVYNDTETNRAVYGGLYTYEQVMAPGFVPAGWHVPTAAEWQTLITAVGGDAVAGGVLKEAGTTRWNAPNTGAVDTYDFAAVGSGYSSPSGVYDTLKAQGMFWTADPYNTPPVPANMFARYVRMNHDIGAVVIEYIPRNYFLGVRLIKDTPWAPFPVEYGYLYNWYAATDERNIAASGWHVPTNAEWLILFNYLGGVAVAGGKLKEIGLINWDAPNTGATNEVGFNSRGAGYRLGLSGAFTHIKNYHTVWTTTDSYNPSIYGIAYWFRSNYETAQIQNIRLNSGASIRLIKDSTTLTHGQTGTYTGNDGRIYRTICIGTQEWLADNLCETLYRNGDPIPEVTDNAAWAALTTGARCSYDNLESNAHA